ncbi:MAG: zinc ribbon domain-containing protein [Planctomycetota bacterium]
MHSEVEKLLRLQAIDGRLEILRKEIASRPQIVEAQDSHVAGVLAIRTECEEAIRQKTKELDRLRLDLGTVDARLEASRAKLNMVKADAEYKALNVEIERFQAERAKLASRSEDATAERAELQQRLAKSEADLSEARQMLGEDERELQEELDEIRSEAAELIAARDEAEAPLVEEVLNQYSLLFSRYRERSVVPADGGVCTGCYITLSPQTLNQLRAAKEIITCMNCSRILYI